VQFLARDVRPELERSCNLPITTIPIDGRCVLSDFFSETLEMIMGTPSRPTAGPLDLNELLHFNPNIIADPVPWWWLQQLDRAALSKLAQISMARQKEVLAAQTKALDAAMRAIGE
jgi:hypothetical protein